MRFDDAGQGNAGDVTDKPPVQADVSLGQQVMDLVRGSASEMASKAKPAISEKIGQVIDFAKEVGVESILSGVCRSGAQDLATNNMDKLLNMAAKMPDGKLETTRLADQAVLLAGGCLDRDTANFLRNVQSIEKRGNHFEVEFKNTSSIKIGETVPGTAGLVELSKMQMDKVSFDLVSKDGAQQLANIKGMNLKFEGPMGYDFDGTIKNVTIVRGADDRLHYQAQVAQKSVLAHLIGAPSEVTINLKPDSNGHLVVTNPSEIKTKIIKSVAIGQALPAVLPGGLGTAIGVMTR
ncbi:hypothetical protein KBI23_17365 [bacterium]|nr:hypothetical protein [bacterium]MBP9809903.1 hypothetical protein [bacterium]